MSASARNCDFIDGGHDIACAAIRQQVKQEFAERWKQSTWREALEIAGGDRSRGGTPHRT